LNETRKNQFVIYTYISRSECYCDDHLPIKTKGQSEIDDVSSCCSWTCSGQFNETCGGNLCNSVYAVNGTKQMNPSKYFGEE
jgi:hypothetical protein